MEESKAFKSVLKSINQLEKHLLCIHQNATESENNRERAEREIEEHFGMCFNALAARKEIL